MLLARGQLEPTAAPAKQRGAAAEAIPLWLYACFVKSLAAAATPVARLQIAAAKSHSAATAAAAAAAAAAVPATDS